MQRQIADFIEEQGAAIGRLKAPDPVSPGIGKGALHMAEQFAVEQAFGDGTEIDREERLVRPAGTRVEFTRH